MIVSWRRAVIAGGLAASTVFLLAEPAWAHGIGGRTDLPLPAWQLAWAAAFAVASSFVVLGTFWEEPRLASAAEGRIVRRGLGTAGTIGVGAARVFGLVWFGLATPEGAESISRQFPGDREYVRRFAANVALQLVRRRLQGRRIP